MSFMRKHSENSSNKLMGNSHDSLSERQAVLFSFKEIRFKEGITSDNSDSHKIDNSSEMTIASFGDSACALKLAGLKDRRVKPCKSNKGLMRGEVTDIAYFSQESSPCSITDTVNGSDNLHFLNSNGRAELREDACNLIKLLHKMKERRNLPGQDELFSEANRSDRVFSGHDNLISADRDLSASAAALKRLCNNLSFRGSDKAGRREFLKKQKHGSSKDITCGLQFRKDALENPLNLVFGRSDKVRDGFSFSGNIPEVSDVLRNGELPNRLLMDKNEPGDGKGVFLIRFGLSQRQLCEIGDQKGINDNGINLFGGQEGKKIDMVTACGFHSSHDRGEVFTGRSNSLHEFRKTAFIHSSRQGKTDIAFGVNTCGRKRILRYINTNKETIQSSTSVKRYSDKAGEASRPILHDDKGSKTQSTYYGYGRQGTDSFKGSLTQGKWSSPACPALTGKTRLYKFYNTNS
jgi:hypothetical protein